MIDEFPTTNLGPRERLRVVSATLVVTAGPDRGKRVAVQDGRVKIGTSASAQLVLADPAVSRVHCEVDVVDDRLRLRDAESTNGTWVDGVRVRDADLCEGSLLRLGSTTIRVELGDDPVYLELSPADRFGKVLGSSVAMRRLYAVMGKVASGNATVLIQGETGTGKELIAQALHDASDRADGPFVVVDCGALASTLIESELFGHVRGAFTGATSNRDGLIAAAGGGTLFLDEIGELPVPLQPKLLRVLESRELRPVGSNVARDVDVRVIAATNRSLAEQVNEEQFREDLYYRLAVIELLVPPLRARREDVPVLAQHFAESFGIPTDVMTRPVLSSLMKRSWPGNVRELRNVVERTVSMGPAATIPGSQASSPSSGAPPLLPFDFDGAIHLGTPLQDARRAVVEAFERSYLRALIERADGNISRAAQMAGVNRRFLYRTMDRVGVRPADQDPATSDAREDDDHE